MKVPRENLTMYRENTQTLCRKTLVGIWTQDFLPYVQHVWWRQTKSLGCITSFHFLSSLYRSVFVSPIGPETFAIVGALNQAPVWTNQLDRDSSGFSSLQTKFSHNLFLVWTQTGLEPGATTGNTSLFGLHEPLLLGIVSCTDCTKIIPDLEFLLIDANASMSQSISSHTGLFWLKQVFSFLSLCSLSVSVWCAIWKQTSPSKKK